MNIPIAKLALQQELARIEAEVDAISAAVAADTEPTTESTAINMARYAAVDVRLKRVQDLMNSAVPKV